MTATVLDARGAGKTYRTGLRRREVHALDALDLTVHAGDLLGILGPNGAGKTTLLKLALGIVRPTRGTVSLFGREAGDPAARRRVGYLAENHRFPPHLTARQVLDVYGRLGDVTHPVRHRRIQELLGLVELTDWADRRTGTFSKGMMQRLGLAQALLGDPELLILDEPTDGIDPVGRRNIRDLLLRLNREGMTILLNSHMLSEVEHLCRRVVVLRHGACLWAGPTSDLLKASSSVILRIKRGEYDENVVLDGATDEELNARIDALRSEGVLILSVERAKNTLESGFIRLMEAE
ncbi:MAG: ABC transporter ATP-binding protein [Rhodothermales bacterium]